MQEIERSFGRIESPDSRDKLFPLSAVLPTIPSNITEKYWWDNGWWGDQGQSSECVAYSWLHFVEDGPVVQNYHTNRAKPLIEPNKLYRECQLRDPWRGEQYNGTSVRAGALILKDLGIIREYRWASSVNEIKHALLTIGPMVVGTKWYSGMMNVDSKGFIKPSGSDMGGHAYVINGVDTKNKFFKIKNSWGKRWGIDGTAKISFDDFEQLFRNGGEACIAFEQVLRENVDWNRVRSPGIYR